MVLPPLAHSTVPDWKEKLHCTVTVHFKSLTSCSQSMFSVWGGPLKGPFLSSAQPVGAWWSSNLDSAAQHTNQSLLCLQRDTCLNVFECAHVSRPLIGRHLCALHTLQWDCVQVWFRTTSPLHTAFLSLGFFTIFFLFLFYINCEIREM